MSTPGRELNLHTRHNTLTITCSVLYLPRCGLQTGSPAPLRITPSPGLPTPADGEDEEDQTTAVPHFREGRGWGRGQDAE